VRTSGCSAISAAMICPATIVVRQRASEISRTPPQ
jgi:hypothetical protein